MLKKIVIACLLVLLGYLIGTTNQKGTKSNLPLTETKTESSEFKKEELSDIAECEAGRCPKYESVEIDGDPQAETIVLVPVGMTKGAGRVMVVDQGKVTFKSDVAAEMGYKVNEDNTGFTLTFVQEWNYDTISPKSWASVRYVYENGEYVEGEHKVEVAKNKPF